MSLTYVCFVILAFNDFITSSQIITKIENATFQNIDFVEIVKENLQRNNEDYGEIKYNNNSISTTKGYDGITKTSTTTLKVNNNDILKSNRRAIDDTSDYSYEEKEKSTTKEPQLITNATTTVKPVPKILRSTTKKKIVMEKLVKRLNKIEIPKMPHTVKPITNATQTLQNIKDDIVPKLLKKNKIEKFKKFMVKNKGLLKDFLSNKKDFLSSKKDFSSSKKDFSSSKKDFSSSKKDFLSSKKDFLSSKKDFLSSKKDIKTKKPTSNSALRTNDVRNNIFRTRGIVNYDHLFADHNGRISVDVLDMAPAKGGRIHRQRLKGRLCQRHVLVPEGPKYDSQGKWYLPAHNLVVSHPYNVTTPPKLLLPRCCNCCKKSVLGCE